MTTLYLFLEVITVVCAPSLIFAAWIVWRAANVENEAVSLVRDSEN
jgi:hypothetical protein